MTLGCAAICLLAGMSAASSIEGTGVEASLASAPLGLHQQVLSLLSEQARDEASLLNASLVPALRDALADLEKDDPTTSVNDADIKLLVGSLEAAREKGLATPGMMKFVENVTNMIDKDMAVKVKAAHKAAQSLVTVMLNNFASCKAGKKRADSKIKLIASAYKKKSTSHKQCRGVEQNWWNLKTGCQRVMRTKLRLYKSECKAMRLLQRDPNKEADNCHTTNSPEPYGNWLERNYRWFVKKDSIYQAQKRKCDRAKADYFAYKPGCDKKTKTWTKKRAACNADQSKLEGQTCSAAKLMVTSCDFKYKDCYADALEVYTAQVPILKKNERDRKLEWRALMRIKCLLGTFADEDGAVDSNQIDVCKKKTHSTRHLNINYGKIPAEERCAATPNIPCSSPFYDQEYRRLPRNAKQAKCSQCKLPMGKYRFATKPIYWLKAQNYIVSQNTWRNRGGKGTPIRSLWRAGNRPWVRSYRGYGAQKPITALFGTHNTKLYFGNIFPSRYTICSLTRYTGNRHWRSRILNGGWVNWLHGHWAGRPGVAHYGHWMTSSSPKVSTLNWVAMCGRNKGNRRGNQVVNGKPYGTNTNGRRPPFLAVNMGRFGNERSDFAIAEILIFQETLGDSDMMAVEQYLMSRLKLQTATKPDINYKTKAMQCSVPQLSKLDPGTGDKRTFRCLDGTCISMRGRCNKVKNCRDGSDEKGCGRTKAIPNKKYVSPAKTCSVRARLRLERGKGDSHTFRCKDGRTCIKAMGRCNGFKNCNDGSDEKGCPPKVPKKTVADFRKNGQTMMIKYMNHWPHCTNLHCFGNTPLAVANLVCLKNPRCDGFSFSSKGFSKPNRGGGCYKQKCKVDSVKGYGKPGYGYMEKRKRVAGPKCKDLVVQYSKLWNNRAVGVDFSAYMRGKNKLRWIGCQGNGCKTTDFLCRDLKDGVEFGTKVINSRGVGSMMRALLGSGVATSYTGCCSASRPTDVCNAPSQESTVESLCKDIGYARGKIVGWGYNGCPAVQSDKGDYTSSWKSPPGSKVAARIQCLGKLSLKYDFKYEKSSKRLPWVLSKKYAENKGGRLMTIEEARSFLKAMGGALYPKEDQWAAVTSKGKKDYVQVGNKPHHTGKSHVRHYGFPKWDNPNVPTSSHAVVVLWVTEK